MSYGARVDWATFKEWLDSGIAFKEISLDGSLLLVAVDGNSKINCIIHTDGNMSSEYTDYTTNYQSLKNKVLIDRDEGGRSITRIAATRKGWHYQAHSVQFEVNLLDSVYNKDCNGNDLGFADLKIYKSDDSECTDQADADTNGVKTILTWSPNFDFEIIQGNIRQENKETVDSYFYVNARVYTGLAAPNDFVNLPFVEGGINLNYIGDDEPLSTDGRASKFFNGSNGDHFQVIVNYEADLLTNINRHKMSIIFEIYKDPTA